jgi:vacuolar-type H+-ATPase subunit E/Vma4
MALSELLRRLEQEADSRAADVRSTAHADASRIAAESAADLARRRTLVLAQREAALRATTARETAVARRAATAELLTARAEVLDRIIHQVNALLVERRGAPAVLECAAVDLNAALGFLNGGGTARCRPELIDWVRAVLPAGSGITVEADPSVGIGAVVRAADGSVEIDATVEHRLGRLRSRLAVIALAMLQRSDGAAP